MKTINKSKLNSHLQNVHMFGCFLLNHIWVHSSHFIRQAWNKKTWIWYNFYWTQYINAIYNRLSVHSCRLERKDIRWLPTSVTMSSVWMFFFLISYFYWTRYIEAIVGLSKKIFSRQTRTNVCHKVVYETKRNDVSSLVCVGLIAFLLGPVHKDNMSSQLPVVGSRVKSFSR